MEKSVVSAVKNFIEVNFYFDFQKSNLSDDSNLFQHGVIDSYGLIELVGFLEKTYSIEFSEDDLASPLLSSLSGLEQIVLQKKGNP